MPTLTATKYEFKKIILAIISLVFAFALILISIFSLNQSTIAAEDESIILTEENIATNEAEATKSADWLLQNQATTEYQLPYPGILPDHPLYWLKMVRDRIWLWFTKEPVRRTERLILYADKRLGAGKALIEGNKKALGVTTLTKAEKYLERALVETQKLPDNLTAKQTKEHLRFSAAKHEQTLDSLEKAIPDSLRDSWSIVKEVLQRVVSETNR